MRRKGMFRRISILVIGAAIACLVSAAVPAADLPKATLKILGDLKLQPGIMSGIDKELQVPPAWLTGARHEGAVKILGSWDNGQFAKMVAPFKERYPFIALEYSRGDFNAR